MSGFGSTWPIAGSRPSAASEASADMALRRVELDTVSLSKSAPCASPPKKFHPGRRHAARRRERAAGPRPPGCARMIPEGKCEARLADPIRVATFPKHHAATSSTPRVCFRFRWKQRAEQPAFHVFALESDSRLRLTAARLHLRRSDSRAGFQRAMPFGGVVGAAPLHAEGKCDANRCHYHRPCLADLCEPRAARRLTRSAAMRQGNSLHILTSRQRARASTVEHPVDHPRATRGRPRRAPRSAA